VAYLIAVFFLFSLDLSNAYNKRALKKIEQEKRLSEQVIINSKNT
jgi:hypothetical protein